MTDRLQNTPSRAARQDPAPTFAGLLERRLRWHEMRAQTERRKTDRTFEAAYFNALWELREDLREAGLL